MILDDHLLHPCQQPSLATLTQEGPHQIDVLLGDTSDASAQSTCHDGILMDMVYRVRRKRHQGSLTVYLAEQLTCAHMRFFRVLLQSHGVAIGTIVHTRYFDEILHH